MRAPAVSFANKLWAAALAALLTFTLLPASALAEGEGETADASTEELQEVSAEQVDEGSGSTPVASTAEDGTLASALVGTPTTFINSDVALDGEPVVGSFTVDGLTFAVTGGSNVELVGVSPDRQQVIGSQEGDGAPVAPMLASGPDGLAGDSSALALPESVTYNGVDYAVASIGAYAFYLSGVTTVELPASVGNVDDRAFRSSDVSSVAVADGNPSYSSFDGALYDADQTSLLLIPEGKQGTVLLPSTAESAAPSVFSHCPLVTQVSVEEGSAAFASENGLLYSSDLTTLLRVPAGATDIAIHDGCTTIAAGAMEACASLATITAPASVTSISPDVFTSVPTVSLPVVSAVADDPGASTGATEESSEQAGPTPASSPASTQLIAMVALSSTDDDLPEVDPSVIGVRLAPIAQDRLWENLGFSIEDLANAEVIASTQEGSLYGAAYNSSIYCDVDWWRNIVTASSQGDPWMESGGAWVQVNNGSLASFRFYQGSLQMHHSIYNRDTLVGISPSYDGVIEVSYGRNANSLSPLAEGEAWTRATYNTYFKIVGGWTVSWDANGGNCAVGSEVVMASAPSIVAPIPTRVGYKCTGWFTEEGDKVCEAGAQLVVSGGMSLVAQWERVIYDLSFDTSTEPKDDDYPGVEKPDMEDVDIESGAVQIEDPKRPGYVFQGWVIPDTDGKHAIDQDLVYKDEADGKWYVDASKLPDYADDEGRVELTARWTSIISVDVPSAVTFYADVVTQGNESREGAASSAFGQNKVASQSQVDLRIVGLESTAVATEGTTLGADSILKKSDSATPSSSTQKLFSLYPTDKALTPDDLQDPDAVSATKPSDAVDFALDDLLLEKSFAADAFTIPAGDTLNLGYRLNLAETGTELDYDTLSTLDEGQSASIANISYCFAADAWPAFWTYDDNGRMMNLYAIQADAEAIASGDADITAKYMAWMNADHRFYVRWFDKGVVEADADSEDDSSVYEVRIIGLNHDDKSDGSGKAGITFQLVDCLDATYRHGTSIAGGWQRSELRAKMNPDDLTAGVSVNGSDDDAIWDQVPEMLQEALVTVAKKSNDRQSWNSPVPATDNKLFLLCMREYYPYTLAASVIGFYVIPAELNSYNCTTGGFGMEGDTYDYYVALGCPYCNSAGSTAGPPSAIAKKVKGAASSMWVRSLSISDSSGNRFNYIKSNGAVWDSVVTNAHGVSPAFCL